MGTRFDVFLSYSSSDRLRVEPLCIELQSLGLAVFFATQQVHVGDSLYSFLNTALAASDYVVFCISQSSVASGWVEREIGGTLATQVSSQRKRILPVLLDDARIPALLGDLAWLDMATASPAEVAGQIGSAIMAARSSDSRSGSGYGEDIAERVESAVRLLKGERVASGFCWAIISGASSTGKDVLSYTAVQHLQQSHGLTFLRKMTTRSRRPSEPDYVIHTGYDEFKRRMHHGEIMFPFRKRTTWYGFDGHQFRLAVREGVPLLSVFTDFGFVPPLVEAVGAVGVRAVAFLIHAEKADLNRRILFRNLPQSEVTSRIASIDQDYREMGRRTALKDEYQFIENGDATAFKSASAALIDSLRRAIEDLGDDDTA